MQIPGQWVVLAIVLANRVSGFCGGDHGGLRLHKSTPLRQLRLTEKRRRVSGGCRCGALQHQVWPGCCRCRRCVAPALRYPAFDSLNLLSSSPARRPRWVVFSFFSPFFPFFPGRSEAEIGDLIASAMERVGNEGVITVQVCLVASHAKQACFRFLYFHLYFHRRKKSGMRKNVPEPLLHKRHVQAVST